jgi:endoglycosylceramidase
MFGEYGAPTFADTDRDPEVQDAYRRLLIATVAEFDARVTGCVKAWWCGSRVFTEDLKKNPKARTWALFSDDAPTGRVERRYIADVIARPRPLAVSGEVKRFGFDFATRRFEMVFVPDAQGSDSEFFVPAARHFAQGFRAECGGTVAAVDASGRVSPARGAPAAIAGQFRWDAARQRLTGRGLGVAGQQTTLRIEPV